MTRTNTNGAPYQEAPLTADIVGTTDNDHDVDSTVATDGNTSDLTAHAREIVNTWAPRDPHDLSRAIVTYLWHRQAVADEHDEPFSFDDAAEVILDLASDMQKSIELDLDQHYLWRWTRDFRHTIAKERRAELERERLEALDVAHKEPFEIELTGKRLGKPSETPENVRKALRRLGVKVYYDTFAERKMIIRHGITEVVQDHHVDALWFEIDRTFGFKIPFGDFQRLLGVIAHEDPFHPVCDYLKHAEASTLGLDEIKRLQGIADYQVRLKAEAYLQKRTARMQSSPMTDRERVETWLIRLCGAKDTPYVRAVSRVVLVAAVRRVRQPGCKFDEMLILESTTQGTDKTTFVGALAVEDDWFGEEYPLNAPTKETMELTAGKWIMEAGELAGLGETSQRRLKTKMSRKRDEARMAYGREVRIAPRQNIVIGTTNDKRYLRDVTGNRRYWPVEITRCDVRGLRAELDDLWGAAARLETAGESIRLAPSLWDAAAEEQADRRVTDPYEIKLRDALDGLRGKLDIRDAWRICGLGDNPKQADVEKVADVMTVTLKWVRDRRRKNGPMTYCYVPGDEHKGERLPWLIVGALGHVTSGASE